MSESDILECVYRQKSEKNGQIPLTYGQVDCNIKISKIDIAVLDLQVNNSFHG